MMIEAWRGTVQEWWRRRAPQANVPGQGLLGGEQSMIIGQSPGAINSLGRGELTFRAAADGPKKIILRLK